MYKGDVFRQKKEKKEGLKTLEGECTYIGLAKKHSKGKRTARK
jgi:hypothetical protein